MRVLMIGDIVGPDATAYVARQVPLLRQHHQLDLVIANGENCAITAPDPGAGFGILLSQVEALLAGGVDVITSGNYGWDGPDAAAVHRHPRVLRPHNLPPGHLGTGYLTMEVAGELVTVINFGCPSAVDEALPVYPSWQAGRWPGTVIIDFHGDAAWKKLIFATAIDGQAAAVLGTHTHEATIPLHILPGGTALVTDVGMTGPSGYPGGFPLRHFAARLRGEDAGPLGQFTLAAGPLVFGAVLLDIVNGRTGALRRLPYTIEE